MMLLMCTGRGAAPIRSANALVLQVLAAQAPCCVASIPWTTQRRPTGLRAFSSAMRKVQLDDRGEPVCQISVRRQSGVAADARKTRVVIVGTGWAGYALAKQLDPLLFEIHVCSPRNFMLFTPLLASTAVGTLEFRSIAQPVPSTIPQAQYHMANVTGIDFEKRVVNLTTEGTSGQRPLGVRSSSLPYDVVVVACGAKNNTFNIPGVESHAMFLKELWDARAIRQKIITNVEAALFPGVHPRERRRLLSFVIVGGGPTGVEFAAELHDFVVQDLLRFYPAAVSDLSITLIEGRSILGSFDASLREYAERKFRRDKIVIRTGANVTRVEADQVHLSDGDVLPHGILVWNTGLAPQPLVRGLGHVAKDKWGHVLVNESLQVLADGASALAMPAPRPLDSTPHDAQPKGSIVGGTPKMSREELNAAQPVQPDVAAAAAQAKPSSGADGAVLPGVYAVGDAANVVGRNYAATAQVAEQQGTYLAECLNAAAKAARAGYRGPAPAGATATAQTTDGGTIPGLDSRSSYIVRVPPPSSFNYVHRGSLAMLGSFMAVTDFTSGGPLGFLKGTTVRGFSSWVLWRSAYLTKLGTWRNRLQVPTDWARTFFFGRDVTSF